jgi:hypothetical protein
LSSNGSQLDQWTQVSNLIGNNIAYNSVDQNIRNIYSAVTKENDTVDLIFADGVYGNLPQGSFRVYYRVSNGLSYTIYPNELRGINISVSYINKAGVAHSLTIGLALQSTVANAAASEDIETIRTNAPAVYYTQNRMITGEDYNLAPLASSQNIVKIKAVNRTSSGISRNFDILDASGKYSDINVFSNDGFIYKEENEQILTFKFDSRIDIINFIRRSVEPVFTNSNVYNFYFTKFDRILFTDSNTIWQSVSAATNISTGYFKNVVDNALLKVGTYSTNNLKYLSVGALIKFVPPAGKAFKRGTIVDANATDPEQVDRLWTKVAKITGDGTNAGRENEILTSNIGPVTFSDIIPTGAIASRVVPKFVNNLPVALENEIVNQAFQNLNFGLRYDVVTAQWKIITASNIDLTNSFTLGKTGDTTNTNLDSSWIIAFVKEPDRYVVRIRYLSYIFGSVEQNRFYFDSNEKQYNDQLGNVIKDQIKILNINTSSDFITSLKQDVSFEIFDTIKFDDGYESSKEIKLSFADSDDDGVIDNPEAFEQIVGDDQQLNYLFFQETVDQYGTQNFNLIDNSNNFIVIEEKESLVNINDATTYPSGQLIYFYDTDENVIKRVDRNSSTSQLILESSYKALSGRRNLKFQYIHNASVDRRIDPSTSNIIDLYLLTR